MKRTLIPIGALSLLLATTALAQAEETVMTASPAQVTLLPGWRMENGHHMAALRVVLDEGWKTYWRAPGEGGIPPNFNWSGSQNLASVTFHWPVPEVIGSADLETLGYRNELVLPIEVTPTTPGADISLSADLLLGICEHICVPVDTDVSAELLAATTTPNAAIERALANRPDTRDEAGVTTVACQREDLDDGVRITAQMTLPQVAQHETVVFEAASPEIWVSEAMEERIGDTLIAYADLVPPSGAPFPVTASEMRMTVLGDGRAVDINGCDSLD